MAWVRRSCFFMAEAVKTEVSEVPIESRIHAGSVIPAAIEALAWSCPASITGIFGRSPAASAASFVTAPAEEPDGITVGSCDLCIPHIRRSSSDQASLEVWKSILLDAREYSVHRLPVRQKAR